MSHGSLHVMNQRFNSKLNFKGNKKHSRSDDYASDSFHEPRYRRETADNVFDLPSRSKKTQDLHRGDHVIGSLVSVFIAGHILEMSVLSFDSGERVVVTDKQGFIHFVEPSHGMASAHGAEYVAMGPLTCKIDAGFKPSKNTVLKTVEELVQNPALVNRKYYKRIAA